MSNAPHLRLFSGMLLAGVLIGKPATTAEAPAFASLDELLLPTPPASLLGPIASAGRKAWDCAAERAASASDRHDAALPGGERQWPPPRL